MNYFNCVNALALIRKKMLMPFKIPLYIINITTNQEAFAWLVNYLSAQWAVCNSGALLKSQSADKMGMEIKTLKTFEQQTLSNKIHNRQTTSRGIGKRSARRAWAKIKMAKA